MSWVSLSSSSTLFPTQGFCRCMKLFFSFFCRAVNEKNSKEKRRGSPKNATAAHDTRLFIYLLWIKLCLTVYVISHDNRYIADVDKCCNVTKPPCFSWESVRPDWFQNLDGFLPDQLSFEVLPDWLHTHTIRFLDDWLDFLQSEQFRRQISHHGCCQKIRYNLLWARFNVTGVARKLRLCCDGKLNVPRRKLHKVTLLFSFFVNNQRFHAYIQREHKSR